MYAAFRHLALLAFAIAPAAAALAAPPPDPAAYKQRIQPFFEKYCYGCHGPEKQKAELGLHTFTSPLDVVKNRKTFDALYEALIHEEMPPEEEELQPTLEERNFVADWVKAQLNTLDCSEGPRDPGRVTIRRLNRTEYANTIRDLLDVDYRVGNEFPGDDVGYGFDNIGDVLSMPPVMLERYFAAAQQITDMAIIAKARKADPKLTELDLEKATKPQGVASRSDGLAILTEAELELPWEAPEENTYQIIVHAYGEQAGGEPVKAQIKVDGRPVKMLTLPNKSTRPFPASPLRLKEGKHTISVAFINDFYDDGDKKDRNLIITAVGVKGPLIVPPPPKPDSHDKIIIATPGPGRTWEQAARVVLEPIAFRAFRRPVTPEELDKLVQLTTLARHNKESFEAGIQIAIQAMLVSPHFLFRVELDKYPDDPTTPHLISEFELASRLSYFLWSSMPDDELLAEAKAGTLRKNLEAQVRRMLDDRKAEALVENFAGQWLQLRMLDSINPDRRTYRKWDDKYKRYLRQETEEFFEHIMEEDLSVLEFLDADFTFLNEDLAEFYGIEGVEGRRFQKVQLTDRNRGGILTHASILVVTSNPTRTSPVKRGKYILENILGEPPPPPPPGAGELPENADRLEGTLREQMEQHRRDPSCANCHKRMDPLGFAFENFDGIGQYREQYRNGTTIDASGELPGGVKLNGPAEVRTVLMQMHEQFVHCMAEKMLTYALGRGVEYYDYCALKDITASMKQDGYRFSSLVLGIARSEPFQMRRAKEVTP